MTVIVYTQTAEGADDQHEKHAHLFETRKHAENKLRVLGYTEQNKGRWYKNFGFHNEFTADVVDITFA
jgi:hypothetical protein